MDDTEHETRSPQGGDGYSQFQTGRLIQSLVVMTLVTAAFYALWG